MLESASENKKTPLRVMIVDDSAIIRSIIEKILKSDPDIFICGFASNGLQAVQSMGVCNPDIIVLDIEMPVMDGITAIPLLLEKKKDVRIIMCSTLSERGASVSIEALSLGATDYILKPSGAASIQGTQSFHVDLLQKIKLMGKSLIKLNIQPSALSVKPAINKAIPKIIAIGSSTGGPQALEILLKDLQDIPVPIVITQHMPKTFTRILAEHLTKTTGMKCVEGQKGMTLSPGKVYIAPGGYHMLFTKVYSGTGIVLDDGPMENYCKPAVNPMMRSLIDIYGSGILMAVLTGMGEDGLEGAQLLSRHNGHIIAQDAASSVVWGMPGAVAQANLCDAVMPLKDMAAYIGNIFSKNLHLKNIKENA